MVLREGDRVRISSIGKDYKVKWIGNRTVVLETQEGASQFLTTIENVTPLFASQRRENEKEVTRRK
jgi:hypothetical protein